MSIAIKFEAVSKKFSSHQGRGGSFQEALINLFQRRKERASKDVWVLKDVSFQMEQGETVGLIGPNGTGKSTTLKLISQILYPASGQIEINGRVGALLELGSGFHPDLSGRENIFLNGAILGLSRDEVRRKLDEIIAFAELEESIDMPVKHYSSGMYVRLGFAVAVNIDPEILIIDEVLAVGDASFQRKCMDKIDDMRRQGTTIFLVSHSLDAVRKVCRRTIWMEGGHIIADGPTETVVKQYLWHTFDEYAMEGDIEQGQRWGNGKVTIEKVQLLGSGGEERSVFATGDPMTLKIHYRALKRIDEPVFGLAIHRGDGMHITGPNTHFMGYDISSIEGDGVVQFTVPSLTLLEGTYFISAAIHNQEDTETFDFHDQMYPIRVVPFDEEQYGIVTLQGEWRWDGTPTVAESE